ncbi:MAG TPA: PfkB family carbohydrate kinase [Candidatus Limnocylindrales bacterium]|nr:PfkB family carbohydrate kinase [Candidatus Limnocylindrales bacterium]
MNRPDVQEPDAPFVLVAGAASRDLTVDDPRGWRLGGAVTYGSLTLARLGLRVGAVVGVDAEAAGARELEALEAAGAIVIRAPLAPGPVFEITESASARTLRCVSSSEPLSVFEIPRAWLLSGTPAFLGPVAGELGADWAAVAGGELALGWQGLLRELRAGEVVRRLAPAGHPLLKAATLVAASREDLGSGFVASSAANLLHPSATLVVTDGSEGGEVLEAASPEGNEQSWRYTAVPSDRVTDPTGAGDVFLAAMLAARIDPTLGPDVLVGAAAASLAIEGPGVDAVPTRAAVLERMRRAPSLASRWASDASSRARGRPSQA